jgi:heme A synthase
VRAVRYLAAVTAVITFCLIVLGAVVRTTGSGLSCPDWPTCYGHWLPTPAEIAAVPDIGYTYGQVMLEWIHRLVAGVVLGPLVLVLVVLTCLQWRSRPMLGRAGVVLILLLVVQGALGGVTVLDQNSPWSVALHLGNALLVLSTILFILMHGSGAAAERSSSVGWVAVAAWLMALLAMMSAAVTAKSGAALACSTWPLCNGAVVPDLADAAIRINFAHRVLAAAVGVLLLALFWMTRERSGPIRGLASLALLLVIVQIALGALIVALFDPIPVAVTHNAVGVLTFAAITLLMWRTLPVGRSVRASGHHEEADGLALRST